MPYYFVYDCETTGFPRCRHPASMFNTAMFDTSRIVSICWILLDENHEEVKRFVRTIQPKDFSIPDKSIEIHGITNDVAKRDGVPFETIFDELETDLMSCEMVISHNLQFDLNVLASELYRRPDLKYKELADELLSKVRFCTMKRGHFHLKLKKWPTLRDLYEKLMMKEIHNHHDALFDTLNCADCYRKLSSFQV